MIMKWASHTSCAERQAIFSISHSPFFPYPHLPALCYSGMAPLPSTAPRPLRVPKPPHPKIRTPPNPPQHRRHENVKAEWGRSGHRLHGPSCILPIQKHNNYNSCICTSDGAGNPKPFSTGSPSLVGASSMKHPVRQHLRRPPLGQSKKPQIARQS